MTGSILACHGNDRYGKIEKRHLHLRYAIFLRTALQIQEIYATINIRVQRLFESAYALALYENCLRYKDVGSTGCGASKNTVPLSGQPRDV